MNLMDIGKTIQKQVITGTQQAKEITESVPPEELKQIGAIQKQRDLFRENTLPFQPDKTQAELERSAGDGSPPTIQGWFGGGLERAGEIAQDAGSTYIHTVIDTGSPILGATTPGGVLGPDSFSGVEIPDKPSLIPDLDTTQWLMIGAFALGAIYLFSRGMRR